MELRNLLFSGCPALGEALDTLEDFTRPPEEIKAAAQAVKDMLLSCLAGKGRILRGLSTIFQDSDALEGLSIKGAYTE